MNVSVPPSSLSPHKRIRELIGEYERMSKITQVAIKTRKFELLRQSFDREFPLHTSFTNSKKLDLMMWQCRENGRSAPSADFEVSKQ
jgi:hypothetical protein